MRKTMLSLCLCAAATAAAAADVPRVGSERSRTPAPAKVQWRGRVADAPAASHLRYPEVPVQRLAAMEKSNAARDARLRSPLQIGVGRVAPDLGQLPLRWEARADGAHAAVVAVTSPVAMGLRVGLRISGLPAGAELRVRGSELPLGEILLVTAAEIAASRANGLYWTPATDGETQTIEIHVPAGTPVDGIRLAAPELSHLVTNSRRDFKILEKIGESGSCNIDTACRVATLGQPFVEAKNAVAHMVFNIFATNGNSLGSYICTGTLLNDTDPATQVPLFFSANHCFAGDSNGVPPQDRGKVAATLVTHWNYEATACGSGIPTSRTTVSGGADLLFYDGDTDAMLLRLRNPAPAMATFAGWDASALNPGSDVVAIHHPAGDAKKVSFGVHLPARSDGESHAAAWLAGTTEGGSSGSGLFTVGGDGQYRLRGGLYGGYASCANSGNLGNPNNIDWYSRLDVVYPQLRQWLSPVPAGLIRRNGAQPLRPR